MNSAPMKQRALDVAAIAWGEGFDVQKFEAASRAYFAELTGQMAVVTKEQEKACQTKPEDRTPTEHFLAICSGNYLGYTMVDGSMPDEILRKIIAYQPDQKSSVLYPLFISLLAVEMPYVTDLKKRPFIMPISCGNGTGVI